MYFLLLTFIFHHNMNVKTGKNRKKIVNAGKKNRIITIYYIFPRGCMYVDSHQVQLFLVAHLVLDDLAHPVNKHKEISLMTDTVKFKSNRDEFRTAPRKHFVWHQI